MNWALPPLLLVAAVAAVGVLHTIVPDHWVPIALVARQRGWSRAETARAAFQAGTGHVLSTLAIALAVWVAGSAFADRFGHLVDLVSSLALIAFGGWIAVSAWPELDHSHGHGQHGHDDAHGHAQIHTHRHLDRDGWDHHERDDEAPAYAQGPAIDDDRLYAPLRGDTAAITRHVHPHRHGHGAAHLHWHDHMPASTHAVLATFAVEPPLHRHRHKTTARTALLLILGSSPMVEGIPAFFAAARYGAGLIATMATVFALSTIATYVALAVYSTQGLQRLRLGAFERYGEVMSGAVIAVVGLLFGFLSGF
jgi:hypothetical protein